MSDVSNQNAERMLQETRRMQASVQGLTRKLDDQNAKIATLSNEVASLKRDQVMATVAAQLTLKGHGGTA